MELGDFVQRVDSPGTLLGRLDDVLEDNVACVLRLYGVKEVSRDERGLRMLIIDNDDTIPYDYIRLPVTELELWDSTEYEIDN